MAGAIEEGTYARDRLAQLIAGEVQFLEYGLDGAQSIRDIAMLPIPLVGNVVAGAESAGIFGVLQDGLDLRRRPDEKLAFDSF
ncbi:MAG: hypothetical protein JW395_1954 [Nitrospira sp.]|nr:hypothetical protein [Nitrospira sp.]